MLSTVRYQKKYRDYQNVKETILICNTIQRLGALVAVFTLVVAVVLGLPTPAQAGAREVLPVSKYSPPISGDHLILKLDSS